MESVYIADLQDSYRFSNVESQVTLVNDDIYSLSRSVNALATTLSDVESDLNKTGGWFEYCNYNLCSRMKTAETNIDTLFSAVNSYNHHSHY